jgi:hypothetical protein
MRFALRIVEMPHDVDGHVRELLGIYTGCIDGSRAHKQNEDGKQPPTSAPKHSMSPLASAASEEGTP